MPFTPGLPARVVTQVTDRMVRIHQPGVGRESEFELGAGATGTIGLFPKTAPADITLPEGFKAHAYSRPGGDVSLQDAITVRVINVNNPAVKQGINIVKTGTTPEDFEISLTNTGGSGTGELEIFVEYH